MNKRCYLYVVDKKFSHCFNGKHKENLFMRIDRLKRVERVPSLFLQQTSVTKKS